MTNPILSARNLSKTITLHLLGEKRVVALDDVGFDIVPGEFIAVVGLSGSGKSSLLKCLYRTYIASSGAIIYRTEAGLEIDLVTIDEQAILDLRRREIRYVPQFLKAAPRLSAVDIVARPIQDGGKDRRKACSEARDILASLGIDDELSSSFPSLFSGGEQQRVNVARAVASPSRLMLLDEPTSALDAENRQLVLGQLQRIKSEGSTVMGVFHDRTLLRELADRVIVMDRGRISQIGRPDEVEISRYVGAESIPTP